MANRSYLLFIPLIVICLSLSFRGNAQTLLPPDQPEQDACHALSLCGGSFFTPFSYQGTGMVLDLSETPCDPQAGGGEDNSMWIKVTVAGAGVLAFKIIPVDTSDDYDFVVLDITHTLCSSLSPSDVVRCNFNNNEPGSNPFGIVGLDTSSILTSVAAGFFGDPFCQAIQATPGQTYLIMINNFGHDNAPGPSSGFTIDFSGSTATFQSNLPPSFQNIVKQCSDSSVVVQLNAPILCSSIAPDGSDFYTSPAEPIAGASGVNCVNATGYTSQVVISFAGHIPAGNYVVYGRAGSSGTTLKSLCGDSMDTTAISGSSLPFVVPSPVQDNFLLPDTVKCDYSTISIRAEREFSQYLWSSGQTTPDIAVINPGIYTLLVTDTNGCVGMDSTNIIDSTCPQYVYFPSAFTPNGDGKNDLFRAKFAGPTSDYKLVVFDRWGRQVFESSDPSAGWDGMAGGRQQPVGTYVWFCVYRLYQQQQRVQKGTVMLIR
jgi:gliding motility-associated-like protein